MRQRDDRMDATLLRKLEFSRIASHTADYCLSPMGRDLLLDARPFVGKESLTQELERVLELRNFLLGGGSLPFSILPDTRRLLRHLDIADSSLDAAGLLDIYHLLFASAQLRKFMFSNRKTYPRLNEFCIRLWLEKTLQFTISSIVDEQGEIRNTASDGLVVIRTELGECKVALRRKMERLLRRCLENGWLMEDVVAMRNGRLTLGFRTEFRHKLSGYVQDYSGSGQTVFVEPAETLALSNRIQELEIAERREIERLLREVSGMIRLELGNLLHNQNILAGFDTLLARARFAVETGSVLPTLDSGRRLRIVKGYHPWLLVTHRMKGAEVYPLDLELEERERVLVISGPNAGGKSVAMKTVGLLSCMLMHGYLLPCSESSVFPFFSDLFIEIGDEQSIENDLSSFSSHLAVIRSILDSADERALVLIDELCSGTDVAEGSAIAKAVLDELVGRGATAVVTTHLGELKVYAHERRFVVNGAMEFSREELRPTFRFIKGVPGGSFAFATMKRLGFPPSVVARAENFMQSEKLDLERMLEGLSRLMEENRAQRETLQCDLRHLETRQREVEELRAALVERERELKSSGLREKLRDVEQARREIRQIVQAVKNAPSDGKRVAEARKKLGSHRKSLYDEDRGNEGEGSPEMVAAGPDIHPGDHVRLLGSNTTGEVESVQGRSAVVRCGDFRLTAALKSLEKVTGSAARKIRQGSASSGSAPSWTAPLSEEHSTTLDLRGMHGEEAINAVERFLDTMSLNRIRQVTVIHGKGTGSLRRMTAECFRRHRAVKSFRLGEWGEGGTGVTVVVLRS